MNKIRKICLLFAMHGEAKSTIDSLGLTQCDQFETDKLPCEIYAGKFRQSEVFLVTYGKDRRYDVDFIGPIPAALTSMKICEIIEPEIVISCGTAGGFKNKGAEIGTVYLSAEKCIFHDRRIPLPGFDESGIGHYPVLNVTGMAKSLDLPLGIVSSGSSLEKSEKDLDIMKKYDAVAKEMEAASIALVCSLHEIPFFCIKSITNLLDIEGASESQFQKNFEHAVACLHKQILRVLDITVDNTVEQLGSEF